MEIALTVEAVGSESESERAVIIRARDGDAQAFGVLVERYMKRAYFAALGLAGSHEDALDLSQQAFVRAWSARARIDPERPFYTWLYAILRRLCFNFTRDRKLHREKLAGSHAWLVGQATARAAEEGPEESAARAEMRERLARAIESLPEREREVIVLKEFEGLLYREIAGLLGIPIGTVMSRLYSARQSLARIMEVKR